MRGSYFDVYRRDFAHQQRADLQPESPLAGVFAFTEKLSQGYSPLSIGTASYPSKTSRRDAGSHAQVSSRSNAGSRRCLCFACRYLARRYLSSCSLLSHPAALFQSHHPGRCPYYQGDNIIGAASRLAIAQLASVVCGSCTRSAMIHFAGFQPRAVLDVSRSGSFTCDIKTRQCQYRFWLHNAGFNQYRQSTRLRMLKRKPRSGIQLSLPRSHFGFYPQSS